MEAQGCIYHYEVRAELWGVALAKIADHYRDVGDLPRALFFQKK